MQCNWQYSSKVLISDMPLSVSECSCCCCGTAKVFENLSTSFLDFSESKSIHSLVKWCLVLFHLQLNCFTIRRFLHQEPWNSGARYLLILNLVQKAREQRFPRQLCSAIERLISVALSDETCSKEGEYQKFQLLLCASEISLQKGNIADSIGHARKASSLSLPHSYLFLGHLQLCRAYAAKGSTRNMQEEYRACLELKTDSNIGWICLKLIESQFDLEPDTNLLEMSLQECSSQKKNSWKEWMAVYSLALGLVSIRKKDFFSAEEFLAQACSLGNSEGCLLLCHGAVCMELARQSNDSQFLSRAVKSLSRVQASSLIPLPIVYTLLAQAHGSLGSKERWEKNLRLEWFCWPPGTV